jgi:hypothetical protein
LITYILAESKGYQWQNVSMITKQKWSKVIIIIIIDKPQIWRHIIKVIPTWGGGGPRNTEYDGAKVCTIEYY